jgi:hypothetical protein
MYNEPLPIHPFNITRTLVVDAKSLSSQSLTVTATGF